MAAVLPGAATPRLSDASAAHTAVCSPAQKAKATRTLSAFKRTMAAKRKSYFRTHKSAKARAAFVKRQKATLRRLQAAARCQVPPPPSPPVLPPSSPGPSCTPSLAAGANPDLLYEGSTDYNRYLRPAGAVRAVVVFVQFPGAPGIEDPRAVYDSIAPRVADWYAQASYGRLSLTMTPVLQWVTAPDAASSYFGSADGIKKLWRDAVAAADPYADFSRTPAVFLWSSASHALPVFADTLPPGQGAPSAEGEVRHFVKADITSDASLVWRYWAHELGHLFGLPDLYRFEQRAQQARTDVGSWDIMSTSGISSHFLAWQTWKLGWLDPQQIRCLTSGATEETLTPLETSGGVKAVVIPTGVSTAYAVEVRQPVGVDAHLCDRGVLIYTVDATVPSGQAPIHVLPEKPDGDEVMRLRCGPTYDAAFDISPDDAATFDDNTLRVEVLATNGSAYRVRITRK